VSVRVCVCVYGRVCAREKGVVRARVGERYFSYLESLFFLSIRVRVCERERRRARACAREVFFRWIPFSLYVCECVREGCVVHARVRET